MPPSSLSSSCAWKHVRNSISVLWRRGGLAFRAHAPQPPLRVKRARACAAQRQTIKLRAKHLEMVGTKQQSRRRRRGRRRDNNEHERVNEKLEQTRNKEQHSTQHTRRTRRNIALANAKRCANGDAPRQQFYVALFGVKLCTCCGSTRVFACSADVAATACDLWFVKLNVAAVASSRIARHRATRTFSSIICWCRIHSGANINNAVLARSG